METVGPEGVGYALLRELPLSGLIIPFFLVIVFITAITAFDSTTNSMSGLSIKNISVENQEAPTFAKVIWGVLIGGIAYIMISATGGVAGIKTLSNLGGFPAILLELGAAISVFVMVKDVKKYEYQEDTIEELKDISQ
ncbi:BCCT, betaine/carnitine/choline family transporter [Dethiosulfatibacter aminovorans DSM 17477]|uniref:BCCT, betaine/carnitine/choline family transporter n=1 Tax=Dethiosulfatibacter aminovorans DSM 17477 TaxID=1121476 RepID=A0A1M6IYS4_9FIRM|nr:BCCT, betaine/carnitine/choline family transporter [Dethiosulfatibacter aminovorans DSM 17477]